MEQTKSELYTLQAVLSKSLAVISEQDTQLAQLRAIAKSQAQELSTLKTKEQTHANDDSRQEHSN